MLKFYTQLNQWMKMAIAGAVLGFAGGCSSSGCLSLKMGIPLGGGASVDLYFLFDQVGILFSLSVLVISSCIFVYSGSYMAPSSSYLKFHWILGLFVASMLVLIHSPGTISVILGWDGLGVTSYLLVCFFSTPVSNKAGFITLITNRLGDALIILAISLSVGAQAWLIQTTGSGFTDLSFLILATWAVAAFTKSAQVPFSAWLPAAMAAPTPVSSLVHSSTLVTAGCYLLIRWYPMVYFYKALELFLMVGGLTCVLASMAALVESDFKKMIALSTLSQLGLMMLSLSLGSYLFCWFHLLVHAYFKAVMFMVVGSMIHEMGGSQNLNQGFFKLSGSPISYSVLMTSNLSLMGIPFVSGFYSKDLILEKLANCESTGALAVLGLLCCLLTSLYSMRVLLMLSEAGFLSMKLPTKTMGETWSDEMSSMGGLWVLALAGAPLISLKIKTGIHYIEWDSAKLSLFMALLFFIFLSLAFVYVKISSVFFVTYLAHVSVYFSSFNLLCSILNISSTLSGYLKLTSLKMFGSPLSLPPALKTWMPQSVSFILISGLILLI